MLKKMRFDVAGMIPNILSVRDAGSRVHVAWLGAGQFGLGGSGAVVMSCCRPLGPVVIGSAITPGWFEVTPTPM